MVLTSSSFMSFIRLNRTLLTESVDRLELDVDLIHLSFQPREGDISANPEQMG
ncbi:hypothetical protein MTR_3g465810 [Medicago truncatula]|uniref:Uncharacterized protein n=1 Tax=Medicago truncatula TaxID=3880 RepID=A0A072UYB7_MEDTR|nr:hypothetical protein MTR_3g465810 [Medicago truncatula]